jgi:hypothetical protein
VTIAIEKRSKRWVAWNGRKNWKETPSRLPADLQQRMQAHIDSVFAAKGTQLASSLTCFTNSRNDSMFSPSK